MTRTHFLDPNQNYEGISEEAPHLGGYVTHHLMTGTWCPEIWGLLIEAFGVKTMTDVGCGDGQVANWFAYRGIDSIGVDGCAKDSDGIDAFRRVVHDYSTGPLELSYRDLCWSAEFVEHVEADFVPNFLATFRRHRVLALTHALPGHAGWHHVNCIPPSRWIDTLESDGWRLDHRNTHDLRSILPRDGFAARCVKETLLLFVRA